MIEASSEEEAIGSEGPDWDVLPTVIKGNRVGRDDLGDMVRKDKRYF